MSKNNLAHDREQKRLLRQRWREAGCCGDCGTPVERFAHCIACRRRHAKKTLAYWYRKKAAA